MMQMKSSVSGTRAMRCPKLTRVHNSYSSLLAYRELCYAPPPALQVPPPVSFLQVILLLRSSYCTHVKRVETVDLRCRLRNLPTIDVIRQKEEPWWWTRCFVARKQKPSICCSRSLFFLVGVQSISNSTSGLPVVAQLLSDGRWKGFFFLISQVVFTSNQMTAMENNVFWSSLWKQH